MWELTQISIDLVCSSEFFDKILQKIANVIPTAVVKQSPKVHGPLVYFKKALPIFHDLFNIVHYGGNNFKTLLTPSTNCSPKFSNPIDFLSQWFLQKFFFWGGGRCEILKILISTFFLTWYLVGAKISNYHYSLNHCLNYFNIPSLKFSSQLSP